MEYSIKNEYYRKTIWRAVFLVIFVFILCAVLFEPVSAEGESENPGKQSADEANAECLACHEGAEKTMQFPNGDELYLQVTSEVYGSSVHGENDVLCTDCHSEISGYPHPDLFDQDYREYQLEYQNVCADCHEDMCQLRTDCIHFQAFREGDRYSAICSDCHNAHSQKKILDEEGNVYDERHLEIPLTCAKCHNAIYEEYEASVHGAALKEANLDVPTCTDCHDVHLIKDPDTSEFHLGTVDTCSHCHTDDEMMAKYDLSTEVTTTYVADFHGTTVTLFEKDHPEADTNKPVCYDCHGYHDILSVDDPEKGIHVKENMLGVCQKCHPDATEEFPDTWLSHYIPDPDHYPLVYYVDLIFKIYVSTVLGGMAFFVATDIYRRIRTRNKSGDSLHHS